MRLLLVLAMLHLAVVPALAQEPPAAAEPTTAGPPAAHSARQTLEQQLYHANATHNGHLTLEEAKLGFKAVARHFADIDVDHKGYVTENDIRAWRIMRKAARRLAQPADDKLKPGHAYQRTHPDARPVAARWTAALSNENSAVESRYSTN